MNHIHHNNLIVHDHYYGKTKSLYIITAGDNSSYSLHIFSYSVLRVYLDYHKVKRLLMAHHHGQLGQLLEYIVRSFQALQSVSHCAVNAHTKWSRSNNQPEVTMDINK